MLEDARSDPRLAAVAAALALGDTPEGRGLCARFVDEAERLERRPEIASPRVADAYSILVTSGMAAALDGIAAGLAIAADSAEYLASIAAKVTPRSRRPEPSNEA